MASFGVEGFAHEKNAPQGQTLNQNFYLEVLKGAYKMQFAVNEQDIGHLVCVCVCARARACACGVCARVRVNTLVHLAQSAQQCLARHCILSVQQPLYSTGMFQCDFFPFIMY
jgi:hypothetical protein